VRKAAAHHCSSASISLQQPASNFRLARFRKLFRCFLKSAPQEIAHSNDANMTTIRAELLNHSDITGPAARIDMPEGVS
jgi:hypothetical protein